MIQFRKKAVCVINEVVVGDEPTALALHQRLVGKVTGTAVYLLDSRKSELQQLWHSSDDISDPERAKPYNLSKMCECAFTICTDMGTRIRKVLLGINGVENIEVGLLAEGVEVDLAAILRFNEAVAAHCCGIQNHNFEAFDRPGTDLKLTKIP